MPNEKKIYIYLYMGHVLILFFFAASFFNLARTFNFSVFLVASGHSTEVLYRRQNFKISDLPNLIINKENDFE